MPAEDFRPTTLIEAIRYFADPAVCCWLAETQPHTVNRKPLPDPTPFQKFERLARALVAVPKRRKRARKRT